MIKIVINLMVTFYFLNSFSASAMSLNDLKKHTNKENQIQQHMYVMGVGQGIFWANVLLELREKHRIFCPDKSTKFTGGYFLNMLEDMKKDPYYFGKEGNGIEMLFYWELERRFPCGANSIVISNRDTSIQQCAEIAGTAKKQLPKKVSDNQTVVDVECLTINGRISIVYKNVLDFPSSSTKQLSDSFEKSKGEIKRSIASNTCKDANSRLLLRDFNMRHNYVSTNGDTIGFVDLFLNDCS
jgi:hypothetical protein